MKTEADADEMVRLLPFPSIVLEMHVGWGMLLAGADLGGGAVAYPEIIKGTGHCTNGHVSSPAVGRHSITEECALCHCAF